MSALSTEVRPFSQVEWTASRISLSSSSVDGSQEGLFAPISTAGPVFPCCLQHRCVEKTASRALNHPCQ